MGRVCTRRELLMGAVGLAAGIAARPALVPAIQRIARVSSATAAGLPAAPGWTLSPANPVLDIAPFSGWTNRAVYDASVVRREDAALWMWYSTRGSRPLSVALAIDSTGSGDSWARYAADPVLQPAPPESRPYTGLTRPSVLLADGWRMWYSVAGQGEAWIGTARSDDGAHWTKHGCPVLLPAQSWEQRAVQCPNVIYDAGAGLFKMWYSGGELDEPDAVGCATSPDGETWTRVSASPIFTPGSGWDGHKIGSFQVRQVGDWHYAFYNAFQERPFVSRIGMARSRDGVGGWERHPDNPILSPGESGSWDAAMVYKPTALWDEAKQRWDVWFNAADTLNGAERIGHAWSDRLW